MRTLGVSEHSTSHAAGRSEARWAADDALTDLYAAHWAALVRLAWLLVRDQGRAEEITQDVFVAAHPRMAQLREDGNALAYLRRSVVNGCRSSFRHRGVEERYLRAESGRLDAPGRQSAESAESVAIRADEAGSLLGALAELSPRQREVLILRYYSDLSELQIAEALDISPGSVKSHAHRGLAALRDQMEGSS